MPEIDSRRARAAQKIAANGLPFCCSTTEFELGSVTLTYEVGTIPQEQNVFVSKVSQSVQAINQASETETNTRDRQGGRGVFFLSFFLGD